MISEEKLRKIIEKISKAQNDGRSGVTSLSLRSLDIDTEVLKEIMPQILKINNLMKLDLSINSITQLPESVAQLSNLTSLDVSNTSITQLPESIAQLSNLTELDVSNTSIIQLPESIGQLSNLTELDLSRNSITQLPKSIGQLSNLTKLDLSKNSITQLPESIGQLPNLTELDLSRNSITQLPESVAQLSNLTSLNVSNTSITQLPESIAQLSNLTSLDVSSTSITQLPESIGQLSNLTELSVSYTSITQLPESIGQLSNLTYLSAAGTRITDLPEELANLENIMLDFRLSRLSPEALGLLTRMEGRGNVNVFTDMSAHDMLESHENVLRRLYPDDQERKQILAGIENSDLDDTTIIYGTQYPKNKSAKEIIKEFLSKVPLNSGSEYNLYAPTVKILLAKLQDLNIKKEDRNLLLIRMATSLGDCATPVKELLMKMKIEELLKQSGGLSEVDEQMIGRLALMEEAGKLKGFRDNEKIEAVNALVALVYSPNRVDQKHQAVMKAVPDIKFVGESIRDLPLISSYPVFGFTLIKDKPELIEKFAALVCEMNGDKPVQISAGEYKLDEKKLMKLKDNLLHFNELQNDSIATERKKCIQEYPEDMQKFMENPDISDTLFSADMDEVGELMNFPGHQEELRGLLKNENKEESIKQKYTDYVKEQQSKIEAFVNQKQAPQNTQTEGQGLSTENTMSDHNRYHQMASAQIQPQTGIQRSGSHILSGSAQSQTEVQRESAHLLSGSAGHRR
ncbi:leucine-rich repeat domain-containing protein [Chryseobacterium sp. CBSDS_008]|uniref:leucine-rich repeat domain-containing protein n=1 Tax=Chryseobacterium sp. CBSDS_008 TaxID=3415265 RepID=UPI003CEBBBD6